MSEKTEIIDVKEIKSDALVINSAPLNLMQIAIQNNASIDVLERLMALKERFDANEAKKAYMRAMAEFQGKCPIIKRTKEGGRTKEGVVAYKYAPIEDMVEQTKEARTECGFSFYLNTPIDVERNGQKGVEVKMTISHIAGHSEEFTQFMPYVAKTGVMSDPQVLGATQSYAKRYVFANGFGIMTGEDDTDAVGDNLLEMFDDYISSNDYPDRVKLFLQMESGKITSKKVFEEWFMSLPTKEQINELKEVIGSVPTAKQNDFWITFVMQTDKNKFLSNVKQSLKQQKEK